MTRSKAWIRVIGYGQKMQKLEEEFEKVKAKNFALEFTYPTQEERKQIKLVNRDMSQAEKRKQDKQKQDVIKAIKAIAEGKISVDELPSETQEILKDLQLELKDK